MNNAYSILEIDENATEEEIKNAYRNLAKKYNPDKYSESPMKEIAKKKMDEINKAYDEIINSRKHKGNKETYQTQYPGQSASYSSGSSEFRNVRNLIIEGNLEEAKQIIDNTPIDGRTAEWYFLNGSIMQRKGWLDEAYNNFSEAYNRAPDNLEYKMAFNNVNNQRNGTYGGYNMYTNTGKRASGCGACDICTGLVCADCCCECCGGDLISCC